MRTGFILDKAYRELGYKPRSFDQGIALMAEQVKNLG
jgi:dTDP-4-dehydrorhamnose reductase